MLKIVLIVFNRVENIKLWLDCWEQCEQLGELIVIHNYDGSDAIKELCGNIKYIRRENVGLDIGAFQDVVKGKIDIGEWDKILWITDDTIPMRKDFITPYLTKLVDNVGVVCTDLSPYVKTHIRTTGFMIKREVAEKLTFPADPITTKEECYQFEHRSKNAFLEQIIRMKLKVLQVDKRENAPLWDTGYKRKLNRGNEHLNIFRKKNKVGIICLCYNKYPQIISSMICQTYPDWEMVIIHDGPDKTGVKNYITDPRIRLIERDKTGNYGHAHRQWALENIDELIPDCDYVVITNADNYHVPSYLEYMVRGFVQNPLSVAVYCSDMLHNYIHWAVIPCKLQLGYIDCAGVMIRKSVAKEIGWRDIEYHSSDWTYFEDVIKKYGAGRWTKIPGCLLIHN